MKRVGDQQKELVLDISKQLSRHNEIIDKAADKQARMDAKITGIEELLIQKASLNYKRKLEKIEKEHKDRAAAKAAQKVIKGVQLAPASKAFQEDLGELAVHIVNKRGRKLSRASACKSIRMWLQSIESDDDGFRSCHSDEETQKRAQNDRLAKEVLKKRYVSDEEEKTAVSHTYHHSLGHEHTTVTQEDDILPTGYHKTFQETLASL